MRSNLAQDLPFTRGDVPADRRRLPAGHDRRLDTAGADRLRPPRRRDERDRARRAVRAARARGDRRRLACRACSPVRRVRRRSRTTRGPTRRRRRQHRRLGAERELPAGLVGRDRPRRERPVREPRRQRSTCSTSSTSRSPRPGIRCRCSRSGSRPGTHGAGRLPLGLGMSYVVPGDAATERLTGAMFAMRETPARRRSRRRRARRTDRVPDPARRRHASRRSPRTPANVVLEPGEVFEFEAGSGGGWGDPLGREPETVRRDVVVGRLSAEEALATTASCSTTTARSTRPTPTCRARRSASGRLADARPPRAARRTRRRRPEPDASRAPAVPRRRAARARRGRGRERRGARGRARATGPTGAPSSRRSGRRRPARRGLQRSYLDPVSGRALFVEAVPQGVGRSFTTAPRHWVDAEG